MATLDLTSEGVLLVPATKRHARELARIMRQADKDEIRAAGNFSPAQAARLSINASLESYAAYKGDKLLAVFGVGSVCKVSGFTLNSAWVLTSIYVDKYPLTYWRCSKIVVEHLRGKYMFLTNMIHGRYTAAFTWLKRLGFKFAPPETFGPSGALFVRATLYTPKLIEVPDVY